MSEPFLHLVGTLSKAQSAMGPHLVRLGKAQNPDKVRLLLLQREAGQFRGAATALLGRLMQQEASLDLILQTKALLTFFGKAEQQAAALLRQQGQAGPGAAADRDDEKDNADHLDQENDVCAPTAQIRPGRSRPTPAPTEWNGRAAARIAKLGLPGNPSAGTRALPRRRFSI